MPEAAVFLTYCLPSPLLVPESMPPSVSWGTATGPDAPVPGIYLWSPRSPSKLFSVIWIWDDANFIPLSLALTWQLAGLLLGLAL